MAIKICGLVLPTIRTALVVIWLTLAIEEHTNSKATLIVYILSPSLTKFKFRDISFFVPKNMLYILYATLFLYCIMC